MALHVTIRRRFLMGLLTASAVAAPCLAIAQQQLHGKIGNSTQWGSSWLDFGQATSFHAGQTLRITLQDDRAKTVLVRLLAVGDSPDEPAGIVGNEALPVTNRVVTVSLKQDYPDVKQLSVHGGERVWDYALGAGNGPARILTVELLPAK